MKNLLGRRDFLTRVWKVGAVLIGVAGAWTSWDILRPRPGAGFGGVIRTVSADAVPADSVVAVQAARGYLTKAPDGAIVAISEKCPHLGCKVPWCASSGRFECPCHGSVFNRLGEYVQGPAPHGMDYYAVAVVDGIVEVDTGELETGASPGTETIDSSPKGPACAEGSEG